MKKLLTLILFGAGVFSAQALTPVGGDDFNDNTVDPAWVPLFTDPGVAFTETNQRLEFTGTGGFVGWNWTSNTLSAAEDWAIAIDLVYSVDPSVQASGEETSLQFEVEAGGTDAFQIKYFLKDGGFYLLTQHGDNVTDIGYGLDYRNISTNQISVRIDYDASAEMMSASYDDGSGFTTTTNYSVSSWGLSPSSTFLPLVSVDHETIPFSSGDAYFDNFLITEPEFVLSNEVHELKMEYSRDFGSADDPNDLVYWYDLEVETSYEVVSFRVQTLGGLDVTETNGWDTGSGYEWGIGNSNTNTPYDSLLDGEITFTFGFSDGSFQSTILPFTQNDGVTPIPPMSLEPTFTQPAPLAGAVQSVGSLILQWPTPQTGANFNEIGNALKDDDEDGVFIGIYATGAIDNLGWFPAPTGPITTTSKSVQLDQGFNIFAQYQGFFRTDINTDGIPYFYNKLAEVVHEFYVSSPTALYDDFNSGSLDMTKWAVAGHDAGASLTVSSGRLEYANPTGVDNFEGLSWNANSLSTTQNWSVVVKAGFQSEIQNVQLGLGVFAGNQELFLSYRYNDYGSYRISTTGINLDADTDTIYNENYYSGMDETLLRMDYDVSSQTLTTSILNFGRFQHSATVSTSGWGLTDTDSFTPGISVDNFSVPITAGEAYFDNFMIWWGDGSGYSTGDADNDGLPDAWEIQYFGSTNHPNADPNADPDADGNGYGGPGRNWAEWIMGTDPTNANSILKMAQPWEIPGEGYVIDWPSVSGRVYTVQWTDALTNSFQILETGITHPQNSYTDTVHTAEEGGFYNLKVELDD